MSEHKQVHSRRDFLIKTITIAPAVAMGSLAIGALGSREAVAVENHKDLGSLQARDYQPTWFTAEEYAFITAAVARLIPKDERGPGALEAGVPEYIDRQMNTPYATGSNWYMQSPFSPDAPKEFGYQLPLVPRQIYRLGVEEANKTCLKNYGKVFAELTDAQQIEFLTAMEGGAIEFRQLPGETLFALLLQNTREGFFSDPIHGGNQGLVGWKLINFPGARADFMDWVERGEHYPLPPVSIRGDRR